MYLQSLWSKTAIFNISASHNSLDDPVHIALLVAYTNPSDIAPSAVDRADNFSNGNIGHRIATYVRMVASGLLGLRTRWFVPALRIVIYSETIEFY